MINFSNATFLLRFAVAIILLSHSLPSFYTGSVNAFGRDYLDTVGFAPFGLPLAWAVKLSHIAAAFCLIFEKFVKWAGFVTISILITGIAMIHFHEGWYVIGGGRNGWEYNFLLIFALLTVMYPEGIGELRREKL